MVANEIMNVFRKGDPSDIRRARTLAEEVFGEGWEAKGAGVYEEGERKPQIIGCGNCHVSSSALIGNLEIDVSLDRHSLV